MAMVKKCDRCGDIYSDNVKKIEIPFMTDENNLHVYQTVSRVSITTSIYPRCEYSFDLCDKCAEKLIDFLSRNEHDEGV